MNRGTAWNWRPAAVAWVSFGLLLGAYDALFGGFFPAPNGMLGHDYSHFLPWLLDGYFWEVTNGPLSIPWFTPSFCGGQPAFGDPQSLYFSVPQWLTFVFGPLTAIQLTLLLFAGAGFWGTYLLLRGPFRCGLAAGVVGAGLFMFNGFFAHRMLIGHLPMHGAMLVPWVAWLLLRERRDIAQAVVTSGGWTSFGRWYDTAWAALILAYWVYSGMVVLLLPSALGLLMLFTLHALLFGSLGATLLRATMAAGLGGMIAAAKLVASLSFLSSLDRLRYPLPGIAEPSILLDALFRALFLSHAGIAEWLQPRITSARFLFERHEFEYGLTLVPLALILIAAAFWARNSRKPPGGIPRGALRSGRLLTLTVLSLLLMIAIPVALNLHHPWWSKTLSGLPLIGDSSSLFRWWFAYLPLVAVGGGLAFQSLPLKNILSAPIAALLLLLTVGLHSLEPYDHYLNQDYSPDAVESSFRDVRASGTAPATSFLGAHTDESGQVFRPSNANDLLTLGGSPLTCYNPVFGYQLEFLPRSPAIHPGPTLTVKQDRLNLINPVCYGYGEPSQCKPGTPFSADRLAEAKRFASHQSFEFEMTGKQFAANMISIAGICCTLLLFVLPLALVARRRL